MPQPNYGLDPYADEAAEIERKRRYAEALREQSGQPITPYSVGGQQGPISWTQGAAKLLQGYNAGAARKQAEEQAKALRERVQGDRAADRSAMAAALRGREAIPAPPDALGGGPAAPAMPPDPNALQSLEFKSPMFQQAQLQQMLEQLKPPERVDLGDRIGLVKNGQLVGYLPKGATPDATMREAGATQRHLTPSGGALLGDQRAREEGAAGRAVTMRGQNMTDARAREVLNQGKIPPGYRQTAAGALEPIPGGPSDAKEATKVAEVGKALNMYVEARNGLLSGLEGSETGPVAGRMPAVTAPQQVAEGGVAAMAPVLKQLFRVAGEGVFTDRDQALLLDMVPKRSDLPEARAKKMENIDRIVSAKLGQPVPQIRGPQDEAALQWANANANDPRAVAIKKRLGVQ